MSAIVKNEMARLASTLAFLTRLPLGARAASSFGPALSYFPLTGLIIGGFLVLARHLALQLHPALVPVFLLLTWLGLTGGLHLDGLMDSADGLLSGRSPEEILRIMKDSRLGAFGAIAGGCALLLKFHLFNFTMPAGLLVMPVASRLAMALSIILFPPARKSGLAWATRRAQRRLDAPLAVLTALAVILVAPQQLLPFAGSLATAILFSRRASSILGGITGDVLGAACELAEIAYLILTLARL